MHHKFWLFNDGEIILHNFAINAFYENIHLTI